MRTFSGKRSTLALAIAGVTAMSGFMAMPEARAEGFIDDSTLTGGIYYWQRERDRKDVTDGDKYKTNLSHSTWNANLDFQSGYAADMFGLDIAAFTAIEMAENGDSSHPNEIAFSKRLNLQSKCNKKRSTHQLEYNFVSTQKPLPNDEYFLPTSYNKRARKDNDFTRTGQKTSRNCQSTGT